MKLHWLESDAQRYGMLLHGGVACLCLPLHGVWCCRSLGQALLYLQTCGIQRQPWVLSGAGIAAVPTGSNDCLAAP